MMKHVLVLQTHINKIHHLVEGDITTLSVEAAIELEEYSIVKILTLIEDEWDILDALRGDIVGDWDKDKRRLAYNEVICSESNYWKAYQLSNQP